jgi:hypothetical protein
MVFLVSWCPDPTVVRRNGSSGIIYIGYEKSHFYILRKNTAIASSRNIQVYFNKTPVDDFESHKTNSDDDKKQIFNIVSQYFGQGITDKKSGIRMQIKSSGIMSRRPLWSDLIFFENQHHMTLEEHQKKFSERFESISTKLLSYAQSGTQSLVNNVLEKFAKPVPVTDTQQGFFGSIGQSFNSMLTNIGIFSEEKEPKIAMLVKKYKLDGPSSQCLEEGLRRAAAGNNVEDLDTLIKLGCNINAIEPDGYKRTALHWAVIHRAKSCIIKLLANGAKFNIDDTRCLSAYDYAIKLNDEEIVGLFTSPITGRIEFINKLIS